MNKIEKDELFQHLSQFLKTKGIQLQEGSYAHTIEKGCQVLADTINLSQQAMERARAELERVRQVIHEKTAPRSRPTASSAASSVASPAARPVQAKRRSTRGGRTRGKGKRNV